MKEAGYSAGAITQQLSLLSHWRFEIQLKTPGDEETKAQLLAEALGVLASNKAEWGTMEAAGRLGYLNKILERLQALDHEAWGADAANASFCRRAVPRGVGAAAGIAAAFRSDARSRNRFGGVGNGRGGASRTGRRPGIPEVVRLRV